MKPDAQALQLARDYLYQRGFQPFPYQEQVWAATWQVKAA
jgi:hypothetical protein